MDDRICFSDTEAEKLHDKTAYKILSTEGELHEVVVWALMESLDDCDLMQIREAVDDPRVRWYTDRIQKWRKEHAREVAAQNPFNMKARGLLKDFAERRKGKVTEARRQLRRRFDGLDHDLQVEVAKAFLKQPCRTDREFMYRKLTSGIFWDDCLLETLKSMWESTFERGLAQVIACHAERDYVRKYYKMLVGNCRYGDLCIKMGEVPDKERLTPWSYLFVTYAAGCGLQPKEGRQAVLGVVLNYLHKTQEVIDKLDIFEVEHVKMMMLYLGMQHATDEIVAIQRAARRVAEAPPDAWENIIAEEWTGGLFDSFPSDGWTGEDPE